MENVSFLVSTQNWSNTNEYKKKLLESHFKEIRKKKYMNISNPYKMQLWAIIQSIHFHFWACMVC